MWTGKELEQLIKEELRYSIKIVIQFVLIICSNLFQSNQIHPYYDFQNHAQFQPTHSYFISFSIIAVATVGSSVILAQACWVSISELSACVLFSWGAHFTTWLLPQLLQVLTPMSFSNPSFPGCQIFSILPAHLFFYAHKDNIIHFFFILL